MIAFARFQQALLHHAGILQKCITPAVVRNVVEPNFHESRVGTS